MWAYFLIIIASDKVINFKTTFFSWSKWHYTEIKSECREGSGPGTQVIASAATAPLLTPPCNPWRWWLLLMTVGHYIRRSRAWKCDKV